MRAILVPTHSKQFTKPSRGEVFGNIWTSRNIDFRINKGKIRLAERLYTLFDITDDADLTLPVAFVRTNADATERYYAVTAAGFAWKTTNTNPLTGWAQDDLLNTPSDVNYNGVIFGQASSYDRLVAARSTDLAMLNNANARTVAITSSTDATPIEVTTTGNHGLFTGERITISGHATNVAANGTWTITYVSATKFTLNSSAGSGAGAGSGGNVTTGKWIRAWWTGTLAQSALSASNPHFVYQFSNLLLVPDGNVLHVVDDSLVVKTNRITLPAEFQIVAITDDGNRVYLITKNLRGREALVFPWAPTLGGSDTYDKPKRVFDSLCFAGLSDKGIIHVINGKGQLMRDTGGDFAEVPGGALPIFETPYRWGSSNEVRPNGMKLIDGRINILLDASTRLRNMPSGIWEYDKDVGLYPRHQIGQYKATNNDWGASIISFAGALLETDKSDGHFLAGAVVQNYVTTLALRPTIMASKMTDTADQRGWFVTSEFSGEAFRAFWSRLQMAFKKLENSTDAIVVKYRTEKGIGIYSDDAAPTTILVAWTSTTQFTTTDSNIANAAVGDEVEFTVGLGAGALAHISSITGPVTTTYTVTLDEAIPNVSGNAYLIFGNWKKLVSITDQTIQKQVMSLVKRSKWIQFKVEIRGTITSPEIEELFAEFQPSAR